MVNLLLSFEKELGKIKNVNVKSLVHSCLCMAPSYINNCPTSSSGKYHPVETRDSVIKHTKLVCAIANLLMDGFMCPQWKEFLSTLEGFDERFFDFLHEKKTSWMRDNVIAACILHDILKEGWKGCGYTVFEHPNLAADFVLAVGDLSHIAKEIQASINIAWLIRSHMGQWNTSTKSSVVLEKPTHLFQKLVHAADNLAARLWIFETEQVGEKLLKEVME